MTTTPETTGRPVPELEAAKLHKRVLAARRLVTETTERAATAYREAEQARARLATLETQHTQETR